MRPKFFALSLLLLLIQNFTAQTSDILKTDDSESSRFTIGSKGAYGHSFLFPYNNNVFHPSWAIGVSMMLMTGNHLGFSADGLYSSEGAKFSSAGMEATTNISYFRIPVKLNYFFRDETKDFRPKIAVGPSVAFLLEEADYTGYEKMDYGATGSLGFSYHLFRDLWISLDGTYYHGLKDIYKGNSDNERNGNLRLELGLLVGL